MQEIYLDNCATTRVCPESAEKIMEMLTENYGNPSSLHAKGLAAQRELEKARETIAEKLGAQPREIFFTSGGTEANNLAVFGAAEANRRRGNRIVTTGVEHASVLESMKQLEKQGFEVIYLRPDPFGKIAEEDLFQAVNGDTILVSMMAVNHELGAIEPVEAMKKAVSRAKAPALIHIDGVQGFGKIPLRPEKIGADLMTVTAHKIHGPKGAGALYVSRKARILPRTFGGSQERGLRPGTEATPLIAGFGKAAEALPPVKSAYAAMESLRDYALQQLRQLPGVEINSSRESLPYLVNFSVPGLKSETLLHFLAQRGIYVSSGSACAKGAASHVLKAAGLPDLRISSAIRASFSRETSRADIDALVLGVEEGMKTLARGKQYQSERNGYHG